jgi:hypothetical protein
LATFTAPADTPVRMGMRRSGKLRATHRRTPT